MGSMMAAPGSGYASTQNQQQESVSNVGANLVPILNSLIQMQGKFASNPTMELQRQALIGQLVNTLSPGNATGGAKMASNAVDSNTGQAEQQANILARSQGLGTGGEMGNIFNAANQGAMQKNSIMTNLFNPQTQAGLEQGQLNAIGQGQSIPSMSSGGAMGQVAGLVYGRPQVQVQPGFGQILGNLGASYLGRAGSGGGGGGGGGDADA